MVKMRGRAIVVGAMGLVDRDSFRRKLTKRVSDSACEWATHGLLPLTPRHPFTAERASAMARPVGPGRHDNRDRIRSRLALRLTNPKRTRVNDHKE